MKVTINFFKINQSNWITKMCRCYLAVCCSCNVFEIFFIELFTKIIHHFFTDKESSNFIQKSSSILHKFWAKIFLFGNNVACWIGICVIDETGWKIFIFIIIQKLDDDSPMLAPFSKLQLRARTGIQVPWVPEHTCSVLLNAQVSLKNTCLQPNSNLFCQIFLVAQSKNYIFNYKNSIPRICFPWIRQKNCTCVTC